MSLNLTSLQTVTRRRKPTSCLLQYANNNRKQGRFNDVTIQSADTSIPANRMVLSCYCSFFEQIFASETNNEVNDSVVDILDFDGKSLKLLIQYIYSGQICIDSENVFDILAPAHYLELDEVKQFCFELLENCITPYNCITILITAKQYKNFALRDKVYKHISDNYQIISQTPAFLNLDNNELFFIVFHLKTRFYVNDEILCQSLLSWTKQDEETRKRHFHSRLFKFVKVDQLSFLLIRDLLKENLIQEQADYYKLLNDRSINLKSKETKIISIGGTRTKAKVKVVFSLNNEAIEIYPDLPISLDYHCSIQANKFVYVIGGTNSDNQMKSHKALRLDLNEKFLKWEEICSINVRIAPGVAVFNDVIIVCGGYDGLNHLSSAEVYNATLNKWKKVESLNQGRSANQSVTSRGCLYTMGGYNERCYLSSVERLNGLNKSWKFISSMKARRCWFAAVSCNDVVYAIGGQSDCCNALKSVEKYDYEADKWIYVSEMIIERWGHSACVMQGKIFVVGGRNVKFKPVKEIECYDPSTDRWEIVASIDDKLDAHSLVVV